MNMDELSIQLKQEYKSFKQDFRLKLRGNLIVLSGPNGGGKTQLAHIIHKGMIVKHNDRVSSKEDVLKINADVSVNGAPIHSGDTQYVDFRSILKTNKTTYTYRYPENVNVAWQAYAKIGTEEELLLNYQCMESLKEILKKESNANGLDSRNLTKEQFEEIMNKDEHRNLVWESSNDMFDHNLSTIFRNYCETVMKLTSRAYKDNRKVDIEKRLGEAPWQLLNRIFDILGFRYRYKADYDMDDIRYNFQGYPYPLNDKDALKNHTRPLAELSDGERTLIYLVFSLIGYPSKKMPSIVILDEYDATFHPSFTYKFYKLIQEFFLEQGVMVIVVTHSLETIKLAPDHAMFYEVFEGRYIKERVLKIPRSKYMEVYALKKGRSVTEKEIREHIQEIQKINNWAQSPNPILYVEDEKTQIYQIAYLKLRGLDFKGSNLVEIFEEHAPFKIHGLGGKNQLQSLMNERDVSWFTHKGVLALFDFDDAFRDFKNLDKNIWGKMEGTEATGLYKERKDCCLIKAMTLPVPKHRREYASRNQIVRVLEIEDYFEDEAFNQVLQNRSKSKIIYPGIQKTVIKDKERFWRNLVDLKQEYFIHFKTLIDKVEELLINPEE